MELSMRPGIWATVQTLAWENSSISNKFIATYLAWQISCTWRQCWRRRRGFWYRCRACLAHPSPSLQHSSRKRLPGWRCQGCTPKSTDSSRRGPHTWTPSQTYTHDTLSPLLKHNIIQFNCIILFHLTGILKF